MGSFLRRVDIKPPRVIFKVPSVIRSEVRYDFRLTNEARDAGAIGQAYTQIIKILGALDKVPYASREESRLEREAMDGLYKAQDALAQHLILRSDRTGKET